MTTLEGYISSGGGCFVVDLCQEWQSVGEGEASYLLPSLESLDQRFCRDIWVWEGEEASREAKRLLANASPGTVLTAQMCQNYNKPLVLAVSPPSPSLSKLQQVVRAKY